MKTYTKSVLAGVVFLLAPVITIIPAAVDPMVKLSDPKAYLLISKKASTLPSG